MQPLGRKPLKINHPDVHPPQECINWWERESISGNKKAARQTDKKLTQQIDSTYFAQ